MRGREKKEEQKEEEEQNMKLSTGRKSADCSEVLGTGEQSASTQKLTGLSSEVLLSLAWWFRSFGNRKRAAGDISNCKYTESCRRHQQLQVHR